MLSTIEMKQHAISALKARIEHDLKLAKECFDVDLVVGKNVSVSFDMRGRAAGSATMIGRKIAGVDNRKYKLRFNVNMMIMSEKAWWHLLDETVSHEVAHLVDFCQRQKSGHDSRWKFIHEMLGGNSATYHKLETPVAGYVYNVNGSEVNVTATIHNRIQAGEMYTVKGHAIKKTGLIGKKEISQLTAVPTRKDEVAPYKVGNVIEMKAKVQAKVAAKATKVVVPAPMPIAANTTSTGAKRHLAPSGLMVAHKPSKIAVQIWENGVKTKAEFIAAYEAAGCKNADRTFSLVVAWFVGKK